LIFIHKYNWLAILILAISFACITSVCNKTSGNESASNTVNVSNTAKAETISSSVESRNISVKEKIMGSDKKQLSEEDFEIVYKTIRINPNTKVEDITKKLGFPDDYEANNRGYISGNANYRRWNLCYPIYSNQEIRIIILSERKYVGEEAKDGNSFIVGVYLESYGTQKGLKVGDNLEKVLQLYGKPESIQNNVLQYSKGDLRLDVTLDNAMEKVESIFIDYNMKKSAKEQDRANN
jgi:hypothetical protein